MPRVKDRRNGPIVMTLKRRHYINLREGGREHMEGKVGSATERAKNESHPGRLSGI